MVQYIFTPWRDRRELLGVRRQFYPEHDHRQQHQQQQQQQQQQTRAQPSRPAKVTRTSSSYSCKNETTSEVGSSSHSEQDGKQKAVARVSMWMQRGGCPHMVESTALLTAAILSDEGILQGGDDGSARASRGYAVRAAYSAAFSRFVTGLLDSHQDKQRKMSMYDVAKSVGLPATFVELRHQATHEQLPSLTRLREAARKALAWIWGYYWRHLELPQPPERGASNSKGYDANERKDSREGGELRELVMRYLFGGEEELEALRGEMMRRYDEAMVLSAVEFASGTTRDSQVLRRAVALTTEILRDDSRDEPDRMQEDGDDNVRPRDIELVRTELSMAWEKLRKLEESRTPEDRRQQTEVEVEVAEDAPAWTLYEEEAWVPKPIGVV